MIYAAARTLICFVVFFFCAYKINSGKLQHKRRWMILAGIGSLVFYALIYYIPAENLFMTFDTPEEAYFYTHQAEEVEDIVYGQDSCLIVGADSYGFAVRKGDGYKLSSFLTFPRDIVFQKTDKGFMHVYRVGSTDDCYLWGTVLASAAVVEAKDTKGSDIRVAPEQDVNEPHPVFVYGLLRDFEKGDTICLSGIHEETEFALS